MGLFGELLELGGLGAFFLDFKIIKRGSSKFFRALNSKESSTKRILEKNRKITFKIYLKIRSKRIIFNIFDSL